MALLFVCIDGSDKALLKRWGKKIVMLPAKEVDLAIVKYQYGKIEGSFGSAVHKLYVGCVNKQVLLQNEKLKNLKIFGPIAIAALLVLIPVNASGGTLFFLRRDLVVSNIDKLSISNIRPKSYK
ncbi:Uncharacterized protein Fot_12476 [Forsythia ovata]|uniref:Uncharacterized protein n=1 Tax=Forsythia ovata TaxID=205694 RepID=A0ABD1WMM6_9LAMI